MRTTEHATALVTAALSQDAAATQQAANAALRELSRPELRDLLAQLAWGAGCLGRRWEATDSKGDATRLVTELGQARQALPTTTIFGVGRG